MFQHRLLGAIAFASVALTTVANAALPTLEMKLTSGPATSGVLIDSAHTGKLTYDSAVSGAIGAFKVVVATGTGVGSLIPGGASAIDLNSVQVTTAAAGTLTLALTEIGLSSPISSQTILSTIGGVVGSFAAGNSTLTFNTYVDAANVAFATTTPVSSQSFTGAATPFAFSQSKTGVATGALFSETILVTINSAANSTTSFNALMTPVPEPASMLTFSAALAALGVVRRRRRKIAA